MDPVIYIVIIAAAVLFLSNIFRGDKDAQDAKRAEPGTRPRAKEGDVDRFLEEINRRRREASERRAAKTGLPAQPPPPLRVEPRRPEPAQRSAKLPSERRPVRPPQPPAPRQKIPIIVKETPPPVVLPVAPVASTPLVLPEVKPTASPPASRVAQVSKRAPSPFVAQLLPLFRSRQTLRSAILLQEILGRPLSQRRKRRL